MISQIIILSLYIKLENVFVKHYAPNYMPDPKDNGLYQKHIDHAHLKLISQSTYNRQWNFKTLVYMFHQLWDILTVKYIR